MSSIWVLDIYNERTEEQQNVNGNNHTDCNGLINDNAGCGIIEWSRASYGPFFDAQGGGVFVMKWDENGISVCKLSPRGGRVFNTHFPDFIYRVFLPQSRPEGHH